MRAFVLVLIPAICLSFGVGHAAPHATATGEAAAPKSSRIVVLRGAQPVGTPTPPAAAPLRAPAPITVSALDSPASTDAGQCRTDCARTYYFCLGGDDDSCPGEWVSCRAGCEPNQRLP